MFVMYEAKFSCGSLSNNDRQFSRWLYICKYKMWESSYKKNVSCKQSITKSKRNTFQGNYWLRIEKEVCGIFLIKI